jgi:transcriptional regulator with XRE-family HTH domain
VIFVEDAYRLRAAIALSRPQGEVARRTRTSAAFITQLESGKRHPSKEMLSKLALVLRFDTRELFFLARPKVAELLKSDGNGSDLPAWDALCKNKSLRRANQITPDEMQFLSKVAALGNVKAERDLIFILRIVRHAIRAPNFKSN